MKEIKKMKDGTYHVDTDELAEKEKNLVELNDRFMAEFGEDRLCNFPILFYKQESVDNTQPLPANHVSRQHKQPRGKSDIFPIETQPGTTWKQIFFTVRNYERTEIRILPDGIENKLHKEMGLKQRGKENPLPGVLLQLYLSMAALDGYLPAQGNIEKLKGNMSRLRQCFKSLFPNISGDPIPFIDNEYNPAFSLRPDPENFFNQMPDATKDYLETFTKAANRIKSKKILPD